jgi:hypothetical protein
MSEVEDLRQRRPALESRLGAPREQGERAFPANTDALSRQEVRGTQ